MDNAENNATCMTELQALFKKDGIEYDHKDNRIGCYAHIINICVQHIVSSLTKVDHSDSDDEKTARKGKGKEDDEEDDDEDEDEDDGGYMGKGDASDRIRSDQYSTNRKTQKWFEHLKRGTVNRARAIVRTVRSSGQRRMELLKVIRAGNLIGNFKDEDENTIQVKELELIKDVKHRWDSLYLMISRLKELAPVIFSLFYIIRISDQVKGD
jgi:hypothetical protein